MLRGAVTEVDLDKGLGTVRSDDGTEYRFHVIEVADGSRAIDVGQVVSFQPLPKFGRVEAARLHKL